MKYLRLVLTFGLIALAASHLWPHLADIRKLTNQNTDINFIWLSLAGLSIILQYFADGWLSQILLKIGGTKISFKNTVKIASIDVFSAHILPLGEAGAFASAAIFYHKLGVPKHTIIFLSIFWAIITTIALIILLLISIIFLPKFPNLSVHISTLLLTTITLALFTIFLLLVFKKRLAKFAKSKLRQNTFYKEIIQFPKHLKTHQKNLSKEWRMLLLALLAGLIYYAANILSLTFSFMAFGQAPPIAIISFTYLASIAVSAVTLSPAGIGSMEATQIIIFSQFNTDPTHMLLAIICYRLLSFWIPIPAGALSFFSLKKTASKALCS